MANDTLFRAKAPGIMNLLQADFGLDVESAAAILGNLGHESGGFRLMQEQRPTIAGSEGGWGWAQWTGPRRDQFEAYADRNGYDRSSDTANYKWLLLELRGAERAAIPAVKNAVGLEAKVRAFEGAFERAGVKHYESRYEWAKIALDAYRDNPGGTIDVKDAPGTTTPISAPPALKTNFDIQALLPLILGVLTMLQNRQKEATGKTPDIMELLTAILQQGLQPPKPVEPPKPAVSVAPTPTSLLVGGGSFLAGLVAQLNGTIAPPVGETATLPGILTTVLPIAATFLGGPLGAVVSRLLGSFSITRKSS
jgi:hypothetical protein